MELTSYLKLLKRYWVGAIAVVLGCALVAGLYAMLTPPTYTSTSQLYVSVRTEDGSASNLLQGSNYTENQVAAFADLATSPLVLDPVAEELQTGESGTKLAASISAAAKLKTPLINVTASAPTADGAAELSNAVAASMAEVLPELQRPVDASMSPVKITVTRTGQVPEAPTEPNTKLLLALGFLVGLALGVAYAVLRGSLDTKLRSAEDIESVTDRPVLGSIALDKSAPNAPLAIVDHPHSPRSEEVRRLRTNVQFVAATGRARTIMVTSSLPAEGKSTTVANLALALADAGQRVLLVDADLRKPRLAKMLGVEGSVGLTTILSGRATVDDCVQSIAGSQLDVLTSGQIPPNPSELLGSAQMVELLQELSTRYDLLLIDNAPVLPVTDAVALAPFVDGIVVVASTTTTTRSTLAHTLEALDQVNGRVVGVVLNKVSTKEQNAYTYSYGYGDLPVTAETGESSQGKRGRRSGARAGGSVSPAAVPDSPLPATAESHSPEESVTAGAPTTAVTAPDWSAAFPPVHDRVTR